MLRRGYTLILLPREGRHSIKKLHLRSWLVCSLAVLILGLGAAGAYFGHDYLKLKKSLPEVERLQKQTTVQQAQLASFAEKISRFQAEIERLSQFNKKLKVVLGVQGGSQGEGFVGQGGSESEGSDPTLSLKMQRQGLIQQMHEGLRRLGDEASLTEKTQHELQSYLESRKSVLAATPSIWPCKGWVTSTYGYRRSPFDGQREFHRGLDIANRKGTPIVAPANGVVASVSREGGYGRTLVIHHGYGLATRYAHLQKVTVKTGQLVKRGQTIALLGNSGRVTGSHLHYEVWHNGRAVNPSRYILD